MRRTVLLFVVVLLAAVGVAFLVRWRTATAAAAAAAGPDSVISLPGLTAPVTIATDRWGIPHVTARNRADLYRAWGYVTARDRMWQLEITRRAAEGRQSEWFGNRSLREDGGAQLFELAARAARAWEQDRADARARVPLEAFAEGVNAYLARCRRGERRWPEELARLDRRMENWRPQDSYLVVYAQAMVLDFALPEIGEADEIARLGREAASARRRFEGRWQYVTAPGRPPNVRGEVRGRPAARGAVGLNSVPQPGSAWLAAHAALGRPFDAEPESRASNAFAVGAGRSSSGRPLVANDPHLPLGVPSALYAVHLTVEDSVDAAGVCTPGVPALISGRNRRVAWGVTSLAADVFDVYRDSLSADGKRVWTGREWTPVRERAFTMRFRLPGGLGVPLVGQTRRYTPHGPVVVWEPKLRRALSVRWTADDVRLTLAGVLGLESSHRATEVATRLATLRLPVFNLIAADAGDDVVYRATGAVPARRHDPGIGPLPGDGREEWRGIVPVDSMPGWRPPRNGFVVSANNRPIPGDTPAPWPRYDFAHDRASRIAERLAGDPRLTIEDLRSVQNDVLSRGARRILPWMLAAIAPARESLGTEARAALDSLAAWDGVARRDRVGPTLFRSWYGAYLRRSGFEGVPGLALAALTGEASGELRDARGVAETPAQAATAALDTALTRLRALLGPDLAQWTWARAHRASFAHRLAWREPDLAVRDVPIDGDNSTVSVGRSGLPWSAAVTHGPAWRMLADLADPSRAWVVLPPGNSGEASAGHDRDMLAHWANHRYVPMLLDAAAVARVTESTTRLVPPRD